MFSQKTEIWLIFTSQNWVFDENIEWSHGHYEHFHKSRFIKMYTKRQKNMISKNHDFQKIKGDSLKIIENREFLKFQKRVGEKQFPAITLTWYYQFAWNLQLWYSFFNAHSMVYLRILGYLLKSIFGNGNHFWKWVFPENNSFWEIRGAGNGHLKWIPEIIRKAYSY